VAFVISFLIVVVPALAVGRAATVGTGALGHGFEGGAAAVVAFTVAALVSIPLAILGDHYAKQGRALLFLGAFSILLLLTCFASAWFLAPFSTWREFGPLVPIFGVLTLINAPFDWAAIGITRFLLRRGLAWGGPWPYALAVVDAVAAAFSVGLLTFVIVLTVQTFDDICVLRAGEAERLLPLGPLFEKLHTRPGDVENWWIWLMLFSTAIPSVVNLAIGSFAFLRGLPFLNRWMLALMPAGGPMRPRDRLGIATALAAQVMLGSLLAAALLYLIFDHIIPLALPSLGAAIRDFSERLAAYNAAAFMLQWLADLRWQ
jgi:hypothetical protein